MNDFTFKVFILIVCHLLSVKVDAQNGRIEYFHKDFVPTILSVHLSGRQQIIFNTAGDPLSFKNKSVVDSTVTKRLYIEKPTHLFYNNIAANTTGEKYESGNLLLLPGDSVVLKNDGRTVSSSSGFSRFIDTFLTIPLNFPISYQNLLKTLDSEGLHSALANGRNHYLANAKRIDDLPITAKQKQILQNFNYVLQAKQVCDIPFDKVKNTETAILDSAYDDLLLHIAALDSLNSGFCNLIYDHIIHYSAFRKGIKANDFWRYFDKADSNITRQAFYQPYLIACLHSTYKNLPDQLSTLSSIGHNSGGSLAAVDTVLQLAAILLQTKTNYKAAKTQLDEYANGRYAYLLTEEDYLHRQRRTLNSLAAVNIIDFKDKRISLQKLLSNNGTDIMVLDFWASWCVPCIADYPYLKKVKEALINQSIRFISISIDVEEDKDAWIKRTKQLNTFNKSYQYRLENPRQSPVNKFFNLYSVPRYIVINKKGNILEEDFSRPGEPAFQRKLEEYLRIY